MPISKVDSQGLCLCSLGGVVVGLGTYYTPQVLYLPRAILLHWGLPRCWSGTGWFLTTPSQKATRPYFPTLKRIYLFLSLTSGARPDAMDDLRILVSSVGGTCLLSGKMSVLLRPIFLFLSAILPVPVGTELIISKECERLIFCSYGSIT